MIGEQKVIAKDTDIAGYYRFNKLMEHEGFERDGFTSQKETRLPTPLFGNHTPLEKIPVFRCKNRYLLIVSKNHNFDVVKVNLDLQFAFNKR